MAAKLSPANMKKATRPTIKSEVMPTATIISLKTKAEGRAPAFVLVGVILESIAGNKGRELASARDAAGGPGEINGQHSQVILVRIADRRGGNRHRAVVSQPGRIGPGGIIDLGEGRGDETGGIDLVPTVEPDGLDLFQDDLRGAEVFARHPHGKETGGDASQQGHAGGADHPHANRDLNH